MHGGVDAALRILIVEGRKSAPSQRIATLFRSLGRRFQGWDLSFAVDLDDALASLTNRCADIVVVAQSALSDADAASPEAIAKILEELAERYPFVALLLAASAPSSELCEKAYAAGVQDVVTHPGTSEELLVALLHGALMRQKAKRRDQLLTRDLRRRYEDQVIYLRGMIDRTMDGIVIVDQRGCIRFVNPAAEQLFRKRRDELVGSFFAQPISDTMPLEFSLPQGDGHEATIEMRVSRIEWEGNLCYLASLRDVTHYKEAAVSLKLAEAEAVRSSRIKSEFLANMSHEIRTPLNGIIGLTRLLQETELSGDQVEYVDTIQTSGDVLLHLINDILDLSKIEAGKFEFETKEFSVHDLVKETMAIYAHAASVKGILLASVISPRTPNLVFGDKIRVRQVLGNLISNAIKFTHEGYVTVYVAPGDQKPGEASSKLLPVCFEVEDTGIGIPRAQIKELFQPFRQLSNGGVSASGTGLGLSICKRLVEMMGGEIGVRSSVNKGSIFRFGLSFPAAEGTTVSGPKWTFDGHKALLFSTSPARRAILQAQFASRGFETSTCGTTAELRQRIAECRLPGARPWRLAVLDCMPVDGTTQEVVWRELGILRQEIADAGLPALLLLAAQGRVRSHARTQHEREANVFVPVHHEDLMATAYSLIEGRPLEVSSAAPEVKVVRGRLPRRRDGFHQKLLIAEDNMVNQLVAIRCLEVLGFRADVVVNGKEAVDQFVRGSYAAILMDCRMPVMDGLQATRMIRALERPGTAIPIIALTANAMEQDRERCLGAGMSGFLSKPFTVESLCASLLEQIPEAFAPHAHGGDGRGQLREGRDAAMEAGDASSQAGLIDRTVIDSLVSLADSVSDDGFLEEAFDAFLKHSPPRIAALHEQLTLGDARAVRETAHSLKGSCANFGAKALAEVSARLEQLDLSTEAGMSEGAGLVAHLEELFARTVSEVAAVVPQLREFIKGRSSDYSATAAH